MMHKEQMGETQEAAQRIASATMLYSAVAVLAFLVFVFQPGVMNIAYGWANVVLAQVRTVEKDDGTRSARPASSEPRSFKCREPLPEFTLGRHSNPSDEQLAELCRCIWSKLPEGGWERRVAAQIRRGEDPGWRQQGFVPRFGAALEACGGSRL